MKLSIVEPFAARPAQEDSGESEANEIANLKISAPVAVEPETSEDEFSQPSKEDLRRGMTRFIDFLAESRAKKASIEFTNQVKAIHKSYAKTRSQLLAPYKKGQNFNKSA